MHAQSASQLAPSDHQCLASTVILHWVSRSMRVRLRVANATHKLEVGKTLEELLAEVGQLVLCSAADVRVGLDKQVDISSLR